MKAPQEIIDAWKEFDPFSPERVLNELKEMQDEIDQLRAALEKAEQALTLFKDVEMETDKSPFQGSADYSVFTTHYPADEALAEIRQLKGEIK